MAPGWVGSSDFNKCCVALPGRRMWTNVHSPQRSCQWQSKEAVQLQWAYWIPLQEHEREAWERKVATPLERSLVWGRLMRTESLELSKQLKVVPPEIFLIQLLFTVLQPWERPCDLLSFLNLLSFMNCLSLVNFLSFLSLSPPPFSQGNVSTPRK